MGPIPGNLDVVRDYTAFWNQWPKDDGVGIPLPGYFADFKMGNASSYAKLTRCMAFSRFRGMRQVSYADMHEEELARGSDEQVTYIRDMQERHQDLRVLLTATSFGPEEV